MPLVIDASVAFKWFVPEIDDTKALALLDGNEPLWAPDLVLAEVGNGLSGRLRTVDNGLQAAKHALQRLPMIYSQLLPTRDFVESAIVITFDLRHPLYDCVYLAVCEHYDIEFVTADKRLLDAVAGTSHAARVRLL